MHTIFSITQKLCLSGNVLNMGYRIVAIVAAICCALGGIVMKLFNENKILGIISSSDD